MFIEELKRKLFNWTLCFCHVEIHTQECLCLYTCPWQKVIIDTILKGLRVIQLTSFPPPLSPLPPLPPPPPPPPDAGGSDDGGGGGVNLLVIVVAAIGGVLVLLISAVFIAICVLLCRGRKMKTIGVCVCVRATVLLCYCATVLLC